MLGKYARAPPRPVQIFESLPAARIPGRASARRGGNAAARAWQPAKSPARSQSPRAARAA